MKTQEQKVLDATMVENEIHVSTIPFSWVLLDPPCSTNIRGTNTGATRDVEEPSEFDAQIMYEFRPHFRTQFIHGIPEGELDAALLWSPIGSSVRRCDPQTGEFLFPSWSWLGWIGHAAYPWAME
jgi:hypothetical protein